MLHFKYKLFCNHSGATPGWLEDSKNLNVNTNYIFSDYINDPLYYFI